MAAVVEAFFLPGEVTDGYATWVVLDVLRATSTIITALASGAAAVTPVTAITDALALRGENTIVGGEREGRKIAGFDRGNSPREYRTDITGRHVVLCTTNGTRALAQACTRAQRVLLAGFLNLRAVVAALAEQPGPVALVCAGHEGGYSLEDIAAAGAVVELMRAHGGDGAVAARSVYRSWRDDLYGMLRFGNHGNYLRELGLDEDLKFCAAVDIYAIVPEMVEGVVKAGC